MKVYQSLKNHCDKEQRFFINISEINLGWKWLTLGLDTTSIIQLPPRKDAWYGFDPSNRNEKLKQNENNVTRLVLCRFNKILLVKINHWKTM